MKCQNKGCRQPIPKGKEKYVGAKTVCGHCFKRLKRRNGISKRSTTREEYLKWLVEMPKHTKNS